MKKARFNLYTLFPFAILLLPACDSDGSDTHGNNAASLCSQYGRHASRCSGATEMFDATIAEVCESTIHQNTIFYGDKCGAATKDYFACELDLGCEELLAGGACTLGTACDESAADDDVPDVPGDSAATQMTLEVANAGGRIDLQMARGIGFYDTTEQSDSSPRGWADGHVPVVSQTNNSTIADLRLVHLHFGGPDPDPTKWPFPLTIPLEELSNSNVWIMSTGIDYQMGLNDDCPPEPQGSIIVDGVDLAARYFWGRLDGLQFSSGCNVFDHKIKLSGEFEMAIE